MDSPRTVRNPGAQGSVFLSNAPELFFSDRMAAKWIQNRGEPLWGVLNSNPSKEGCVSKFHSLLGVTFSLGVMASHPRVLCTFYDSHGVNVFWGVRGSRPVVLLPGSTRGLSCSTCS